MVLALVAAQVLASTQRKAVMVALANLVGAARAGHADPGVHPTTIST
ncbi:MAG TPA: hypothetical protein PK347_13000 [Burkholderiaceae bacterium]|nr:hypothetical protein [Burkholderiaceae bacterium]